MGTYLLETNVVSVFSEALSADVQTVLADETVSVGAGAAETCKESLQTRVLTNNMFLFKTHYL